MSDNSANITESKYMNKLVQSSDKYLAELNKIKRYSDKSIEHFIKVYKGFDKSKTNYSKVKHTTNIINLAREVKNKIFEELASILNDVTVETYETNKIHYKFIKDVLFSEEFKKLDKMYVSSIRSKKTHNIKFIETTNSPLTKKFKSDIRDITKDISDACLIVEKYLRKKRKLQTTWSKIKKTSNSTSNKLKSLVGIGHGRKFQGGKLAFGALSLMTAAVTKSSGFAIPGAYVLNRRREINNELSSKYFGSLNKSRKLKNDIDKYISEYSSDKYWDNMSKQYESIASAQSNPNYNKQRKSTLKFPPLTDTFTKGLFNLGGNSFGGGGAYVAKKKTNIILGDNPGGVEHYAIKRKNKLLTGITSGITGLGMGAGDKLLAMPISGRGSTIVNKGDMSPSSFGAGTGIDESENGVSLIDVAQSQVSILTQIRNDARYFQKETLALKYDELNRASVIKGNPIVSNFLDPNASKKQEGSLVKDTMTTAMGNFLGNGALKLAKKIIPFGISLLTAPATLAVLGAAAIGALGYYFIQKRHTKEVNQRLTKDVVSDTGGQGEYTPVDNQKELDAADAVGKKAKAPSIMKSIFGTSNANASDMEWGGMYAKGGYFRTSKPTLIGVGENGPEDVLISPVGQQSSTSSIPTNRANKKALNVIVTEDKSKQALEQTALLKETNKLTQELSDTDFWPDPMAGLGDNPFNGPMLGLGGGYSPSGSGGGYSPSGSGGSGYSKGGNGLSGGNKENAKFAMDYLMSQGETKENAAAFVGNFLAESGMNPSVKPGDGGTSFGIMQLHDPSRKANFLKQMGVPVERSTLKQQLDFMLWEKKNTYAKVGMMLQNPNLTQDERTKIVEKYYENPKVKGQIVRQNNARALVDGSYYASARKNMSGLKGNIDASAAAKNALLPTTLEDSMLTSSGMDLSLASPVKPSMNVPNKPVAAPTNTRIKEAITKAAISKTEYNSRSNSSSSASHTVVAPTTNVVNNNGGSKGSSTFTTSGEQNWLNATIFSYNNR